MDCKNLTYKLLCSPDSSAIEKDINKIMADNPNCVVAAQQFTTSQYFKRLAETRCPKCNVLICANKALNTGGKCLKCGGEFTHEQFNQLTEVKILPVGTFYLVSLWLEAKA